MRSALRTGISIADETVSCTITFVQQLPERFFFLRAVGKIGVSVLYRNFIPFTNAGRVGVGIINFPIDEAQGGMGIIHDGTSVEGTGRKIMGKPQCMPNLMGR